MSPARVELPGWVDDLDAAVDQAWDPLRASRPANAVFYAATAAGDFSLIWHVVNIGRLASGRSNRREAVRVAVALGLDSLLVNQGIKRAFQRVRPRNDGDHPHHVRQPSTSSFPSGHASSATVAAGLMAAGGVPGLALRTVAGVVATSRIHVRVHHASDVAAGALVGLVFVTGFRRIWPR